MNSDQVKGVLQKAGGHIVEIHVMNQAGQEGVDQPDRKRVGRINRKGIAKSEQQSFDQPDRKRA